jgi:protein-L-isoaspartate O-methyltransferase
MGQNQSLGANNSEFVDSLVDTASIESPEVEFIFRLTDREKFFPPSGKSEVYRDGAWKSTDSNEPPIHISAPETYTNVMENLGLKKGMSFLNVGSGSGYLSSMVGFAIGSLGVNHGIEVNEEIIQFANETKERFIKDTVISGFDWCPPEYYYGNAFNIKTDMKYDRIYCGARVPDGERLRFLKLLKIDGVCIMPYGEVFQRIRRASEKTFLCREISNVQFGDMIPPITSEDEYVELPFINYPRTLFDITRASIRQNVRDVVGKTKKIYVNQKSTLPSTGYPRDASEDEMLIDHPQTPRLDEGGDENIDHRVPPEIDSEGYVIHSLRRHARLHIQINAIIEDDPFEAIEGHFESDSDSDNDDNNDEDAQQQNDDNEEVDIRDGIPAQNFDDMLLNAVAEELMGNDNNSTENEDEELPVPGPSLRRNNGDEIGIQADPERERRRIRDRFEDLIRARFGHDGDVSERRQRTGRFNVIQITPPRRQNQQRDDTSSSSSPSVTGRKRRAESSDSEDKRVKIEEKFFDPPAMFRQQYVKVAVLKCEIPERERAPHDERFASCVAEFDKDFRSILSTFPIPRKLVHQLLFIEI